MAQIKCAIAILMLSAAAAAQTARSAQPDAIVDTPEFMTLLLKPAYVDVQRAVDKPPADRAEWAATYQKAVRLAETANLLFIRRHAGADTPEWAQRSAAARDAGAAVVDAVLVGLRQGGVAIGWGIQFQQPLFLVAMVLLVTLFACNLFGWFEIPLPGWVGDLAVAAPGKDGRHGLVGHFLAGVLATLLATPCSAPFLGTAIGFALAGSAGEIVAVFAAIGVGLALPYLLIAALPGLATRLPRPGRWMIGLRWALGLLLAGTAIWLLDVLAGQLGPRPALAVGGLMVGVAALLRARGALPSWLRLAVPAGFLVLAVAAFLVPGRLGERSAAPVRAEGFWQPFAPERIPGLVGEGKLVFIDVTADWCITCQVNQRLVLDSDAVRQRLSGAGIVAMKADWTLPSDAIVRYLASFGRYGIPFNAVYGPQARDGIALPELLSREAVLDGVRRAGG